MEMLVKRDVGIFHLHLPLAQRIYKKCRQKGRNAALEFHQRSLSPSIFIAGRRKADSRLDVLSFLLQEMVIDGLLQLFDGCFLQRIDRQAGHSKDG